MSGPYPGGLPAHTHNGPTSGGNALSSPQITTPTIIGLMASSDGGNIGASGARFGTGYLSALNVSGASTLGAVSVGGAVTATSTHDIGTTGARFGTGYFTTLNATNIAAFTLTGAITPSSTHALGDSGNRLGTGWFSAININGSLTFANASAKLVPGATEFLIRNTADSANNIQIADSGAITLRSTLSGITTLTTTGTVATIGSGQTDASTILTVGGGGGSPTQADRSALLYLNAPSGANVGQAQVRFQRNGTNIWIEGIDSSGASGAKSANTDLAWFGGSAYVMALSTAGALKLASSFTVQSGQILAPDGTVSAPGFAFGSATGHGFYYTGGRIAMALGGTQYYQFGADGVFNMVSDSAQINMGLSGDTRLYRDAANVLAQRNGTSAQTARVYNTYTDASNYERASIGWAANVLYVINQNAGTGVARDMVIGAQGQTFFLAGGTTRWRIDTTGNLLAVTDNGPTIGAAGATRPSTIYAGTSVVTPVSAVTNYVELDEVASPGTPTSGKLRVYAKSNNKLYYKADDGIERPVGDGSGGGFYSRFLAMA